MYLSCILKKSQSNKNILNIVRFKQFTQITDGIKKTKRQEKNYIMNNKSFEFMFQCKNKNLKEQYTSVWLYSSSLEPNL